tara:strand:+ start:484 stop:648 length:165 start_codon:yes stop_codon:yes gene_type:complete
LNLSEKLFLVRNPGKSFSEQIQNLFKEIVGEGSKLKVNSEFIWIGLEGEKEFKF